MAQLLVFSGSNHSKSINKQLGKYASSVIKETETNSVEINEIELESFQAPIFSIDLEGKSGVPESIKKLREVFLKADGFMFTTPEHNGSLPAFLKNIFDWISRVDDGSIFNDKPVMIISTSPGGRGGAGVIAHLELSLIHI